MENPRSEGYLFLSIRFALQHITKISIIMADWVYIRDGESFKVIKNSHGIIWVTIICVKLPHCKILFRVRCSGKFWRFQSEVWNVRRHNTWSYVTRIISNYRKSETCIGKLAPRFPKYCELWKWVKNCTSYATCNFQWFKH